MEMIRRLNDRVTKTFLVLAALLAFLLWTALERLRALGVQVVMPGSMDMAALREATAQVRQRYLDNLPPDLVQAYLNNAEPVVHATP